MIKKQDSFTNGQIPHVNLQPNLRSNEYKYIRSEDTTILK